MIVDVKREILTALFIEYQKEIPNFSNVKRKFLEAGMDVDVFNMAILKLYNEGYIHGVHFAKGGHRPHGIHSVRLDNALLTGQTVRYLEEKLELESTDSGEEKSKSILKRFTDAGFERAENIIAKIIAEMITEG
ncbi:YjcQ family protein [Bacillus smithii]|uniref:YjcQ family protein n=1 Tax=Bacillus smithii TaxID=1479 RepID=UPI003D1D9A73